jgi:hypothetical protein
MLNEDERKEFREITTPLIKWIHTHCHPHCIAVVDCTTSQLFEGLCSTGDIYYKHDKLSMIPGISENELAEIKKEEDDIISKNEKIILPQP